LTLEDHQRREIGEEGWTDRRLEVECQSLAAAKAASLLLSLRHR